jgi:DNA-binding NtrC family response regulator
MDTLSDPSSRARILIVDDDPDILKSATMMLSRCGYDTLVAPGVAEAWSLLVDNDVDVVLLDLNFGAGKTTGEQGLAFLQRLVAYDRSVVVLVVTGHSGMTVAVAAMRTGAYDFVIKPWNNARLAAIVDAASCERRRRIAREQTLRRLPETVFLLGESRQIERILSLIERVAPTEAGVLVHGPAGSGKSLVARLIHRASRRADQPFHVLDLAAINRVEGDAAIASVIDQADGTLVLDNLDRLPLFARVSLAAALDRSARDVRLIATARDWRGLDGLEGPGGDIMGRLNVIEIPLPPLSERGDDTLLLARHFLRVAALRNGLEAKTLSPDAEAAVASSQWPDGVRSLAAAMERAAILANGMVVEPDDLTLESVAPLAPKSPELKVFDRSLAAAEQAAIKTALHRHGFNVTHAARDLGITRAALYRRMAKYGL